MKNTQENININTVVDNTEYINPFKIELSNDNGKFWFSVKNKKGGTCHTPYGSLSKTQLVELKNNIDKILR